MIIKTTEEREKLTISGRILAETLQELSRMVAPGVHSRDLDIQAEQLIRQKGGEPAFLHYRPEGASRKYPATLCLSINDVVVHGIPNETDYVIQDGDVVTLDLGVNYQGLFTDAAVTVIAGTPKEEDKRLLQAAREALDAAVREAKAGNTVGDISEAIESVADAYGYGVPKELGGHGIGYHVHEDPFVPNFGRAGTGETLEEGMVLAIEPIFTAGSPKTIIDADGYTCRTRDGSRAVQMEHTVIVGKNSGEIVTRG